MVEEPEFEYKYEMFWQKSFSARISVSVLTIAATVFLVAVLSFIFLSQETMKQLMTTKARTQLHDAVMEMRLETAQRDSMDTADYVDILHEVHPYDHSCTLLADVGGRLLFVSDTTMLADILKAGLSAKVQHDENGVQKVFDGTKLSLLVHEQVEGTDFVAAVICSHLDILSTYWRPIVYCGVVFVVGLLLLFTFCTYAIWREVKPLQQFTESAMSIANGNLDTPLPEIRSEDELLHLRNSFEHMQNSLKQYIEDLKVTTATHERLHSELTIAHDIQMGMIPTCFPQLDNLDLYASMVPAKEVGGDLYDFIVSGDELFFIIGDVAGKGVPASLYMAVTRTLFRNLAGNYQSAANIVREINHAIADTNDQYIFVTLFVGVLNLKTRYLSYCNAAHNAPVLMENDGTCHFLNTEINQPVGIENYDYEEQHIDFPQGSALLLYTDGLTEAVCMDGGRQLFGEERLLRELEDCQTESARDVVSQLNQSVRLFANGTEQSDDLTMLFLRFTGEQEGTADAGKGKHSIKLKNEMTEVERLRSFVLTVCRELHADDGFTKEVLLAIEEGVVNIINYAYPKGTRGHVRVAVEEKDGTLTWQLKDSGKPFDPTQAGDADTTSGLEERPVGGLGIYLMRRIMDTMAYERTASGYNVLTLTKKLSQTL